MPTGSTPTCARDAFRGSQLPRLCAPEPPEPPEPPRPRRRAGGARHGGSVLVGALVRGVEGAPRRSGRCGAARHLAGADLAARHRLATPRPPLAGRDPGTPGLTGRAVTLRGHAPRAAELSPDLDRAHSASRHARPLRTPRRAPPVRAPALPAGRPARAARRRLGSGSLDARFSSAHAPTRTHRSLRALGTAPSAPPPTRGHSAPTFNRSPPAPSTPRQRVPRPPSTAHPPPPTLPIPRPWASFRRSR